MQPLFNRDKRLSDYVLSALLILLLPLFLLGCNSGSDPAASTPTRLQQYLNPAAFDILYPSEWSSSIIREGIILFGTEKAVNLDNSSVEPTLVVSRHAPDSNLSLVEASERFLEIGPLAAGFEISEHFDSRPIDGRPAVSYVVARKKGGGLDAAVSLVTGTEADNGHRYFIVATAPEKEFDEWRTTFELMLGSMRLNE